MFWLPIGIRNGIRRTERVEIHQVEHRAEIHRETFLALADEGAAVAATGNDDVVDVVAGIGFVVGDGFRADVVNRLAELCFSGIRGDRARVPAAAIAAG